MVKMDTRPSHAYLFFWTSHSKFDHPCRCYNILYSSPFSRFWSISKVRCWYCVKRPGVQSAFQFIPKLFLGVEVRVLCKPLEFFYSNPQALSCWNKHGLLNSINLKATTTCRDILDSCLLSTLWQQLGKVHILDPCDPCDLLHLSLIGMITGRVWW